ncbi:HEAT repeat domain-containing protein [Paradesertivirga mongoliensis]|uniref:HEAT repeat domain-containing protein n=1 Tax=Paradesertivirga mongoliensis TaxID=2100740 RepID=A0ABW4ZLL8_9SPHI|nr:hypothetical protein [Pedobacter mongoliensis]
MGIEFSVSNYLHDLYISRLSSHPLYIFLSLFIALFCVIGIAEVLIYIFFRRGKEFYKRKRDADLKERIITMLANILVFNDHDDPKVVVSHFLPRFSRLPLYRKSIRKILVAELSNNHANFSGRSAEVLTELYLQLNLDKRARKNLNSRQWDKQIEAIRELTEMSIKDECDKVLKFTDAKHPQLRIEAQIAFVKLCADNPFRFLDTVKEPILDWHQLILFEVITKAETMARPRFAYWLNSANDSVVSFCLKFVEYYQQFDALPNLIYLLNHYNLKIRGAAIEILGRMEAEMAESHLVAVYPHQPQKIKEKILNTLGLIASGGCLSFLTSQAKSKEFPLRLAALRAIKAHRKDGREMLDTLYNEGVLQDRAIIKHILDGRIKA